MEPRRVSAPNGPAAIELFLSYSHKDEEFRNALVEHLSVLQRERLITVWHDRRITAGAVWEGELDSHLLSAGMVLLLVSPSFISSEYCYGNELNAAMLRHEREGIPIVPVLVRPVEWSRMPFARFQALPRNAKPVSEWQDRDAAFRDIVIGIRNTLQPALEAGVIAPPEWWRLPARISWWTVMLVAALLTFLSRVFFWVATPAAPLDPAGTFVVFAVWVAVCATTKYAIERARRISARRRGRRAPNSRDSGGSP